MRIVIKSEIYWLWRAVDESGQVLDILIQKCRNTKAVKRLMKKLLRKQGLIPRVIVTDKLKSYSAAVKQMSLGVEHRDKSSNNQPENSHQWTRLPEKKMRRFKSPGQAQRFLAASELIYQQTQPKRHKLPAWLTKQIMREGIDSWRVISGIRVAI